MKRGKKYIEWESHILFFDKLGACHARSVELDELHHPSLSTWFRDICDIFVSIVKCILKMPWHHCYGLVCCLMHLVPPTLHTPFPRLVVGGCHQPSNVLIQARHCGTKLLQLVCQLKLRSLGGCRGLMYSIAASAYASHIWFISIDGEKLLIFEHLFQCQVAPAPATNLGSRVVHLTTWATSG